MAADPYSTPGQVTPEDQAKWDAYRQSLQQWQTITSHGGNPGPRPVAPTPQETPSMYPSTTQYTTPNSSAGAKSDESGFNFSNPSNPGAPQDSAWTGNHPADAPKGVFYEPPASPGAGGAPGTPNLSTGERVTYNYNDPNGATDRSQQQEYINQLKARAAGQGPSVAQEKYKEALSNINRNSLGMAAQARGGDAVAARRAAITSGADNTARAAQGAALLRATEQTQAQDLLGGQIGAMRTTDTGLAQHIADQTSNTGTSNLNRESTERIQGGAQGVQKYGYDIQAAYEKYKADQLLQAAKLSAVAAGGGSLLDTIVKQLTKPKTVGAVAGGVAGGPAGAAAGGAAGGALDELAD